MMAVLTGRVAVVTGASTGIGAGLAAMLAAEGASVVLAARREAELDRVANRIRQHGGTAVSAGSPGCFPAGSSCRGGS
jgi:short-subunit dehydrogenase